MIVVDTSAVMAILMGETEADVLRQVLSLEDDVRLSAMTDFEIRLLTFDRGGQLLLANYEALFEVGGFSIEVFGPQESELTFEAYRCFGKGNHPAGLNIGDCAAYALARSLDAPLLFKGSDFARTDIRRAL